ncbi:YceH family protein [Chitinivorax sp. B]|uniref:YceH family protein n=1 Tax=Chitinivorax sp. B TaxID=2502235 RepID=UPI0010F6EB29|nr:YceH family protein [Chitinivorax sp. B]
MSNLPFPELSPVEIRILGVLAEKQRTVPDTYPLSLNTLMSGCNQKTSRDPIMELSESDIAEALDTLRQRTLVIESSGGRVARYAHNLDRTLQIPPQSLAVMTTLMLRGPQTAGEIRLNSERLHRFSDISSVEGFLNELAERSAGALVKELPRQPGSRENRWAHLLGGEPVVEASATNQDAVPSGSEMTRLKAEVAELRDTVSSLQAQLEHIKRELGI